MSSVASSMTFLLFKGVRYSLNLIGRWFPVSNFILTVSVWLSFESCRATKSALPSGNLIILCLFTVGMSRSSKVYRWSEEASRLVTSSVDEISCPWSCFIFATEQAYLAENFLLVEYNFINGIAVLSFTFALDFEAIRLSS